MAISNLRSAIEKTIALGQPLPDIGWIGGGRISAWQAIDEMEKESELGKVLIKIWARSEEEIENEIRKAKASLRKA